MNIPKSCVPLFFMTIPFISVAGDNDEFNITDLSAETNAETGITLKWSAPSSNATNTVGSPKTVKYTESFENYKFGDYSLNIGGWLNIDQDKDFTFVIDGYIDMVPDESVPKAFQILSASEINSRGDMEAHTGDQFLCAMCSFSTCSDDWFISPRLEKGSSFSLWARAITDEYVPEKLEILYSETGREVNAFKTLSTENISSVEWQELKYKLPDNAIYFALRYCSNDIYGIGIDDIMCVLDGSDRTINGYNIYRKTTEDKAFSKIAENWNECVYVDSQAEAKIEYEYYVSPTILGGMVECGKSNSIRATRPDLANIAQIEKTSPKFEITKGGIHVYELDKPVEIWTPSGILYTTLHNEGFCSLPEGLYIIHSSDNIQKIVIK